MFSRHIIVCILGTDVLFKEILCTSRRVARHLNQHRLQRDENRKSVAILVIPRSSSCPWRLVSERHRHHHPSSDSLVATLPPAGFSLRRDFAEKRQPLVSLVYFNSLLPLAPRECITALEISR